MLQHVAPVAVGEDHTIRCLAERQAMFLFDFQTVLVRPVIDRLDELNALRIVGTATGPAL